MKTPRTANTQRLNCKIRADIKEALERLAAKRHRMEGGYVGLTRIVNEAGLLLLEREGIVIEADPDAPVRKPAKAETRRKSLAMAGRA